MNIPALEFRYYITRFSGLRPIFFFGQIKLCASRGKQIANGGEYCFPLMITAILLGIFQAEAFRSFKKFWNHWYRRCLDMVTSSGGWPRKLKVGSIVLEYKGWNISLRYTFYIGDSFSNLHKGSISVDFNASLNPYLISYSERAKGIERYRRTIGTAVTGLAATTSPQYIGQY